MFLVVIWISLEAYVNRERKGDFKIEKLEQKSHSPKIASFSSSDLQIV